MLQSIRDYTQGWIAGIIISLIILSFALWGIHSYVGGGGGETAVAKVNGVEITKQQLAAAYERLHRQMLVQSKSTNYQINDKTEKALKDQALQNLINLQVLEQAANDGKFVVSSRQIDSFLASMPEFQVNGEFSMARFQRILEATLYSPAEFLNIIKTSLLIDQPRLGIILSSFALPDEVTNTLTLINQERRIQYLVLPFNTFSNETIQIPEAKIAAYYKQHQDEYKTPEQVSVDYIELSVPNLASKMNPSEEVLNKFYKENSNSFTEPMQWKIDSILVPTPANANKEEVEKAQKMANEIAQKATQGKQFAELILEYSLQNGPDKLQNWVNINQVPAEFQKAVLNLTKKGQVSNPIQSTNGFIILKSTDVKEPILSSYDQAKDKVKAFYIRQQAEEKFAELRDKLSNITFEHPDSLEPAAKALGLNIQTSDLFSKSKGGKSITAHHRLREAAFSNDVLNLNNNSDVIQLTADDVVVVRIKAHAPATIHPLKTVENQIIAKLKAQEMESITEKLANDLRLKLKNGENIDQILQRYHLTWADTGFVSRHNNKIDSAILETGFAMPKLQNDNKGTYDITRLTDGYAVVTLKGIRNIGSYNEEHQQVFAEQIQNSEGLMEYELYKQSLVNKAKVVIEK